jgi:transposase
MPKERFELTKERLKEWAEASVSCRTQKELAEFFGVSVDTIERLFKRDKQAKRIFDQSKRKLGGFALQKVIEISSDLEHKDCLKAATWILEYVSGYRKHADILDPADSLRELKVSFIEAADHKVTEATKGTEATEES